MGGMTGEVRDLTLSVRAGARERRTIVDIGRLDFRPGTLTALSGPSGSGKSTLLYLLVGLLRPDTGLVRWNGSDLPAMSEAARDRWRRENAGFVFQDFQLVEELSPLANVLAPAWFTRFSARSMRPRAEGLLDRFGVPRETRDTSTLSRGEQQRVALARALLFEPKVVFADEPTASLDAVSGKAVAEALSELSAREGRTVIVASHDEAVLERADATIRIERGVQVAPAHAEAA